MSRKREKMQFICPWKPYLVRSNFGYTVEILRRAPGEQDKRGGLELLDLAWGKADKIRAYIESILKDEKVHVGPGEIHRAAIREAKGRLAELERQTAEAKALIASEEDKLRFLGKKKPKKV